MERSEREGDRTVFSIGDASGILRDPILFHRLHRDLAETVLGPLQILSREMSRRHPGGLDVFDESIRGHFRYANSLSAGKCYAWCTFRPLDYFSGNQPPAGLLPPPRSLFPSISAVGVKAALLRVLRPAVTLDAVVHRPSKGGSSGNEVDSGLCDGIPWAHDLVESCLESVRSNGNSFSLASLAYTTERNVAR